MMRDSGRMQLTLPGTDLEKGFLENRLTDLWRGRAGASRTAIVNTNLGGNLSL